MKTAIKDRQLTLLSKKGMRELKKSITQLENDRVRILRELHELDKTIGREVHLARIEKITELEGIDLDLVEKRTVLSNSKLIAKNKLRKNMKVGIGSTVELASDNGQQFIYTLVNSIEANPSDGRISVLSPVGRSLVGKTVRDIIEWGSKNRVHCLRLVRII